MPSALEIKRLGVQLGKTTILKNVSLSVEQGAIAAVLGANGAGKTTLLRATAGLVPFEGEVHVAGTPLETLSRGERVQALAYVPQRSLLDSPLSVQVIVEQGRYALTSGTLRREAASAIEQAMDRVDIHHLADRPFTQLSGGEQRRVLLARALATGARLVLLDEPTASLDVAHSVLLLELLQTLADEGYTFVVVMHDLNNAARFATRAALLHEGRVLVEGPTPEVIAPGALEEAYGVRVVHGAAMQFELK